MYGVFTYIWVVYGEIDVGKHTSHIDHIVFFSHPFGGDRQTWTKQKEYHTIRWVWPPLSNSDHQDYHTFSGGFL